MRNGLVFLFLEVVLHGNFWSQHIYFFLCSMEATVSFCFFLILFSQTFFSFLLSPFLWPSIPNLTSLFSLSITKSKTLVLLSLLDSSFTSCHLILPNCCFTFYFANTFLVLDRLYILWLYFVVPIPKLLVYFLI